MEAALVILAALLLVGCILYVHHSLTAAKEAAAESAGGASESGEAAGAHGDNCCGLHLVCEKDSLSPSMDEEAQYYDDEELDRFAGRAEADYGEEEIEEFRDVLLTLLPSDIAGWHRSLTLRKISLPREVKDELLMIVAEERQRQTHA